MRTYLRWLVNAREEMKKKQKTETTFCWFFVVSSFYFLLIIFFINIIMLFIPQINNNDDDDEYTTTKQKKKASHIINKNHNYYHYKLSTRSPNGYQPPSHTWPNAPIHDHPHTLATQINRIIAGRSDTSRWHARDVQADCAVAAWVP